MMLRKGMGAPIIASLFEPLTRGASADYNLLFAGSRACPAEAGRVG